MHSLLIYNEDQAPFDYESLVSQLSYRPEVESIREGVDFRMRLHVDMRLEASRVTASMIETSDALFISGISVEAIQAALVITKCSSKQLRLTNTDYAFDIGIRESDRAEDIMREIAKQTKENSEAS